MENIISLYKAFNIFENTSAWTYALIQKMDKGLQTIKEWRTRARGRKELSRLDDRMLEDIGLTRYEVEYEINKPFWKA